MELKSGTLDAYRSLPAYFTLTVRASLEERRRDSALWSASSLRLLADAATATARNACARRHITRRNVGVGARTHVLSRRYGGANCNLCLIAVVVGAPRQRELCRRRPFLRFKAFQEGTVSPSFATENATVAPRFSSTSPDCIAPRRVAFINLREFEKSTRRNIDELMFNILFKRV